MEPERKKLTKKPTIDRKPAGENNDPVNKSSSERSVKSTSNESKASNGTKSKNSGGKFIGKKYTDEEMNTILSDGYMIIHPSLWDKIPTGAHIRYIKKDTGEGLQKCERFKPGGFVRNHFKNDDGISMITLENIPGGSLYAKGGNYVSFAISYDDVEELWKKYDRHSFIEIGLIKNSLAKKSTEIENLKIENAKLSRRIDILEEILRNAIKK